MGKNTKFDSKGATFPGESGPGYYQWLADYTELVVLQIPGIEEVAAAAKL